MERGHDDVRELLAAYALGAVPPEEMVEIRAHILECEECMAEADSYSDVAAGIAFAAPPEDLPAGFADRVLEATGAETGASFAFTSRRPRRWRIVEALGFAALIAAVGVLSATLIDARSDAAYQRRVVAALVDSDQGLKLDGAGSRATVVPSGGGALFVADSLPEAPSEHTYQLWLMHGDCAASAPSDCTVVSAGTFETRDGIAVLHTSKPLQGFEDAAVTVEPEGGSDAPTTTPVISSI